MLFDNVTKHSLKIPAKMDNEAPVNVGYLVQYLCDNMMKDSRKELFVLDGAM